LSKEKLFKLVDKFNSETKKTSSLKRKAHPENENVRRVTKKEKTTSPKDGNKTTSKIQGEAFSMEIFGRKLVIGTSCGMAILYNILHDPNSNKVIGLDGISELKISNSPVSLNFEFTNPLNVFLSHYDDNLINVNFDKKRFTKTSFDEGSINELQMLRIGSKTILLAMGSGGFHIIDTSNMRLIKKYSAKDL
jgi:hypothetical protein